jgi:DNA replication protein DnaC
MLANPTLDKLLQLRLKGMYEALQEQLQQGPNDLTFEERLGFLVEREWLNRENNRISRRLKQAKFKENACIEDIDYKQQSRGFEKSFILELAQGYWLKQHKNILITGSTGTGKTYIACAIAHQACLQGYTSRYYRLPRLLHEIHMARADGSYSKLLTSIAKTNIIILDDWGLTPLSCEQRRDLLEIIDDRHQIHSILITSQLPVTHWHEYIGEATLADAILDRLVHGSIKLALKGDSLRREKKDKEI